MRVLLISPNIETLPDPVFPLGAAYVAAALETAGIACRTLDLCFSDDVRVAINKALQEFQPHIVGLSLRNVDNVSYPRYISYLPFYRKVVALIRKNSQATIVLGGSGFTLLPDAILQHLQADYGIAGEGEIAFVKLVNHLAGKKKCASLHSSPIIQAQDSMVADLDTLTPPNHTAFNSQHYFKCAGMGNLQTKRGCPFNCIYCTYPLIEGRQMRMRSPQKIADEIETLLAAGIDTLFIADNEFNYPMDHARAVCQEIIQRKLPVKWSCYANPGFIDAQLIDLMLAAGCTSLEFGTDTACDTMLQNMGKQLTIKKINSASQICRNAGMLFCHSLLLGGPGETMQTVQQSIDFIEEINPTAVVCMIGIRIFPHTALAAIAQAEGRITAAEDFLKPVFYLSDGIAESILPFLNTFSQNHPTWIFPGLQINMNTHLQTKLRRFGIKGPLWEYMRMGHVGRAVSDR